MLKMTNIAKAYGASRILCDVNLVMERGEAVCIAGANAAGKTTLLRITASQLRADSGVVQIDGRVGYVPQELSLIQELSVRDNLALWYAAYNRKKKELLTQGSPECLLGLKDYAGRRVGRLSGGLKKRTAISCALAGNPDYLVMDEPFTALDLQSRVEIIGLLRRLVSEEKGVLFSSHDPAAIAQLADRVLLLRSGVIVQELQLDGDSDERMRQVVTLLSRA